MKFQNNAHQSANKGWIPWDFNELIFKSPWETNNIYTIDWQLFFFL